MVGGSYFLLDGAVELRKSASVVGASLDSVILAASAPFADSVLDVGAGAGAVSLCYGRLHTACRVDALELQGEAYDLLVENIGLNGFSERMRGIHSDLFTTDLEPESYDLLLSNPPHLPSVNPLSEKSSRALAKSEQGWLISDWIEKCLKLVCRKGWLVMIHRSDRLYDVLHSLRGKADRLYIYPLFAKEGVEALRFIICARKKSSRASGLSSPLWLRGLVLHNLDGSYTLEADEILRGYKKDLLRCANR